MPLAVLRQLAVQLVWERRICPAEPVCADAPYQRSFRSMFCKSVNSTIFGSSRPGGTIHRWIVEHILEVQNHAVSRQFGEERSMFSLDVLISTRR